jgi:hypothetical protein
MPKGQENAPERTLGNMGGSNLNDRRNDMFNRNELNNAHLNGEISTDRIGEDIINGDNLMGRTSGRVE